MAPFVPWTIEHIDLSKRLPRLHCRTTEAGVYVVAWWRDLPLAHLRIPADQLPLSVDQLAIRLLPKVASVCRSYTMLGSSGPLDLADGRTRGSAEQLAPFTSTLESICAMLQPPTWQPLSVSVVICTRNRTETLIGCLDAIEGLTLSPSEILVVDNAPSDAATRELVASRPRILYVHEPRPGLDVARNRGIQETSGEIVAFVDDDVRIHPTWLGQLQRAFADPYVAAVTGLVLPAELRTEAQFLFESRWSFNKGFVPRRYDVAYFEKNQRHGCPVWEIGAGANMAARRDACLGVGGFDERLDVGAAGCSGDSEFWYRLLAHGHTCQYDPTVVVFHQHRAEMEMFKRQIFCYMRGHVAALLVQFEKFRHWGNLRRLFVHMPIHAIRSLLWSEREDSHSHISTWPDEVRGCLSGIRYYLSHRNGLSSANDPGSRMRLGRAPEPARAAAELPSPQPKEGAAADVPLVSAVIPCFNQANYLEKAVESVLNQSHPFYELLIVNDGSTDESPEIASRFTVEGRVTVIHQENRGLAAARNRGLLDCRGEYVVFLDADDRLTTDALSRGVSCFAEHSHCAFVYGKFRRIDASGEPVGPIQGGCLLPRARSDGYRAMLQGNCVGMPAAAMYRRDLLLSVGGFEPTYPGCEDYHLNLRLARAHCFCHHDALVAEYRQHQANMSRDSERMLNTVLASLYSQRAYVNNHRMYRRALERGVKNWTNYYGIVAHRERLRDGWKEKTLGLIVYQLLLHLSPLWWRHAGLSAYRWLRSLPAVITHRIAPGLFCRGTLGHTVHYHPPVWKSD